MKNVFNMLLVFGLTLGATVITSCKDYDSDINNLQSQIDANKTSLTELINTKVNDINSQIKTINENITKLDAAYKQADADLTKAYKEADAAVATAAAQANDALEAKLTSDYTEKIEALKAYCAATYATKAELQDAVATLTTAVEKAQSDATDALTKEAELEKAMATAQADIKTAQSTADNAVSLCGDLQNQINELKTTLEKYESDNNAAVAANKSSIDAQAKLIEANAAALAEQGKLVSANTDAIAANGKLISTNAADIATNKKAIEDNATAIAACKVSIEEAKAAADKVQENLDAQVKILQGEIDAANTKIAENNAAIVANAAQIAELSKKHDSDVEAIKAEDAKDDAAIEQLQKDVAQVAADLAQAKIDWAAALEAAVATAKAEAIAECKDYTDKAKEEAETLAATLAENVKTYSDEKNAELEAILKSYAEDEADAAEAAAKVYAAAAAQAAQDYATAYAKAEATQAKEDAIAASEKYAEEIVAAAKEAAIAAANKYTDDEIAKAAKVADDNAQAYANAAYLAAMVGVNEAKDLANAAQASADKAQSSADDAMAYAKSAEKTLTDKMTKAADELKAAITTAEANAIAAGKDAAAAAQTASQKYTDDALATLTKNLGGTTDLAAAIKGSATTIATTIAEDKVAAAQKTLEDADTKLAENIKEVSDKADENAAAIKTIQANIASINAQLTWMGKKLKSLVFDPQAYYEGIEAITYNTYKYGAITGLATADTSSNFKTGKHDQVNDTETGKFDDIKTGTVAEAANPKFRATYFINPANALISYDAANYEYVVNDAKYYTKAASNTKVTVTKAEAVEYGKVKVTGNVSGLSDAADIVTVMALQYSDADTTVTSDFACLKKFLVTDFVLNRTAKGAVDTENLHADAPENHLYKTAKDAAAGDAMLEVAYTSGKDDTLKLDEYINAHAKFNAGSCALWGGQKTLNEEGFKLVYELIGYVVGGVQQSNVVLMDATKTKIYGNDKSASVGMTPMLRVKLVDTNDANKVVAVGYTKINITSPVDVVTDTEVVTYNVKCGTDEAIKQAYLSKDTIEDQLMSLAQFAKYEVVKTSGVVNQYKDAKATAAQDADYGTITVGANNATTWTLNNTQAYNAFLKDSIITTYIKFELKDGSKVIDTVIAKLIMKRKGGAIGTTEEIVMTKADRADKTWYQHFTTSTASKDELHAHVQEARDGDADLYVLSIAATNNWKDGKSIKDLMTEHLKGTNYAGITINKVTFQFSDKQRVGTAGSAKYDKAAYYTIAPNDTKDELVATWYEGTTKKTQTIAKITDDEQGTVEYQQNDVAYDILNFASSHGLQKDSTINATLLMIAEPCDPTPAWTCDTVDVRFLRPINFASGTATITDGVPSTYSPKVDLFFTDWRDYTPEVFAQKTAFDNFFGYYGTRTPVTVSMSADPEKLLSTFYTTEPSYNAELTNNYTFDVIYDTTTPDKVTIKYAKIGREVQETFDVYVPVEVVYDWGTLYSTVKITIKPTAKED